MIDWDLVSTWCRDFLGLTDSDLDSLWYERMAATVASLPIYKSNSSALLSLYQRAMEQEGEPPSWLCHRGLGIAHYSQGNLEAAITALELALEVAAREEATPPPEGKDLVELHLLLGEYAYSLGDNMQKAAEHYLIACKSEDEEQATKGQLGHLKARLSLPDNEDNDESRNNLEGTIQVLKSILAPEGGHKQMADLLKMFARDADHYVLVSKMFKMAKRDPDPDLLYWILCAMHTATLGSSTAAWQSARPGESTETLQGDNQFTEAEARGVLLYDLGVAAYWYKVVVVTPSSSDDTMNTDPIIEALRLWSESRSQLASLGGRNAFIAHQRATAALVNHYFLDCLEALGSNPEDQDRYRHALPKLAELADADPHILSSDAPGFLATLHAMHGDKEKARTVLRPHVKQALQILSDDYVENDIIGFALLQKALGKYQDFRGAAVATSVRRQPDLVTDALLCWEASDVTEDEDGESEDEDNEEQQDPQRILEVLELVTKLAKETIEVVKSEFPDAKQQLQRIEKAKAHIDSLVADDIAAAPAAADTTPTITAGANTEQNVNPSGDSDHDSDGQNLAPNMLSPTETMTETALRLLLSRLSELEQMHTPGLDVQPDLTCNGLTADGLTCPNTSDWEHDFYHCLYCSNRDFCFSCLNDLRRKPSRPNDNDDDIVVDMTVCSAKHRWLLNPPMGDDMYVGLQAKSVRVPSAVRPLNANDDQILKAYYDDGEDGDIAEEITVEEWKQRLANEWDISDLFDSSNDRDSLDGREHES
jgi:tetratricopeptide (TPR) repeat protein